MTLDELIERLERDRELLALLVEHGVLPAPLERQYSEEEAEEARVARVLVRELEVNAAGVEVILHMRRQILALRRQVIEVAEILRPREPPR